MAGANDAADPPPPPASPPPPFRPSTPPFTAVSSTPLTPPSLQQTVPSPTTPLLLTVHHHYHSHFHHTSPQPPPPPVPRFDVERHHPLPSGNFGGPRPLPAPLPPLARWGGDEDPTAPLLDPDGFPDEPPPYYTAYVVGGGGGSTDIIGETLPPYSDQRRTSGKKSFAGEQRWTGGAGAGGPQRLIPSMSGMGTGHVIIFDPPPLPPSIGYE
ncbi:hypothetical protein BDK51DRAFT_45762 [Blyttiomyces helicus]|uniref:Uncharacterized protein n=1 Tax=Blyttiomyces helicus TaxID=388810 RepID=A0A4V1IS88_9FUNG|nr:hypothetical protein BDK51DRAFT_45762 [Blyttiomyces helicus]|eukprot:RKO92707.1 hypothetical protein BDK51DRAFT_45762 [Blyttiomyces helicus]